MITFNEVLSFIENIVKSNVQSAHIVGGDLNFKCVDANLGFRGLKKFLIDHNLSCCDFFVPIDIAR